MQSIIECRPVAIRRLAESRVPADTHVDTHVLYPGPSLAWAEARNLKLSARRLAVAQAIEGRSR
jgi:hypothetical protein